MNNRGMIPINWQIKKLGEVCEIIMGQSPPSETYNMQKIGLPFFQGKAEFTQLHPIVEKYCSNPKKIAEPFDILLSVRAPVGTTNIANQKCCIGRGLAAIRYENYKYIFYFLRSIEQQLDKKGTGSTFRAISGETIRTTEIPLPPLPEQHAIVSKIEELFSELDKGIESLKTAQEQLKVYRRTLMMEGVTGKLTAKWRDENPNVDNSEKIFQKIQDQLELSYNASCRETFAKGKRKPKDQKNNKKTTNIEVDLPELPSSWNYYRLEDITYLVTDGTHFTPKYQDNGIRFLSVKNVRPFYIREDYIKYISEKEHESLIKRCNPQKNDILYTKVGATFGYAAKVDKDYDFSIFVSLCLIKPINKFFSSKFLEFLMNSELVFKQARKRVSGSGVPDLHLIEIRDFKIPLSSLEEQEQIVQELESKLTFCDKIEETIANGLQQSEALRQSILKSAFEGRLV